MLGPTTKVYCQPGQAIGILAHCRVYLLLAAAALTWLGSGTGSIAAPAVTATFEPDTITVGNQATLTLVFDDATPSKDPVIPEVPGLTIQYTGLSQSINMLNGQFSRKYIYNYVVTPSQAGEFTIPAITIPIGTTVLATTPLKLKVVKTQASGEANNPWSRYAFLKLIVARDQVYVGEPLPVEIRLYVQAAQNLQMPQLRADGFTMGKFAQGEQMETRIGNAVYTVVAFRVAVTAVKTGSLSLGPAECSLVLEIPRAGARRSSIFDMFSNSVELRPVTLASNPQVLQILPLPTQNKPPGFNGAIGQFNLAMTAGPTNVAVGDPITLKIQVSGRGSFGAVELPAFDGKQDFRVYPATSKLETTDPLGTVGVKSFEQVITPQNAGVKAIPPFVFAFFDPEQKAYRTLSQPAIPLTVRPTANPASPSVLMASPASSGASAAPARDIVHIKVRPGPLAAVPIPWARQSWFWLLQGFPVLVWLASAIWRKRRDEFERNPRLGRRRAVRRLMREWLAELHRLAAANEADEFFVLLFRILQEQLGERLDLPASAITEAVIDEQLRPRGVPEETLERLQELFRECDQVRFAPQHTLKMLSDLAPKVERCISDLQALPDPQPRGGS